MCYMGEFLWSCWNEDTGETRSDVSLLSLWTGKGACPSPESGNVFPVKDNESSGPIRAAFKGSGSVFVYRQI